MSSFYTINQWEMGEGSVSATIGIDATHPLFKGHFPQIPILPGACMVQLTRHLLDKALAMKTTFIKSGQIKFLQMVNPNEVSSLVANLKWTPLAENQVRVEQSLSGQNGVVFKYSAVYQLA
jgi:3-hydroxyacyl-[acyl-carrier-protein] dehydratase